MSRFTNATYRCYLPEWGALDLGHCPTCGQAAAHIAHETAMWNHYDFIQRRADVREGTTRWRLLLANLLRRLS